MAHRVFHTRVCDHFGVVVAHRAQSAGTLIALGADEIVMSPLGTLGPIDPTRSHPLLPKREKAAEAEPISVQDMRHAMQFIREAAGEEMQYTPEAMAQIYTALFDKIHPLAIGAIEQSYALAKLIANKCLSTHMDSEEERNRIADTLCDNFKSHTYLISRKEARSLGLNAVDAPKPVEQAMMELWKFYTQRPMRFSQQPPKPGTKEKMVIAWLDSRDLNFRVDAEYLFSQDGTMKHQADAWIPYRCPPPLVSS